MHFQSGVLVLHSPPAPPQTRLLAFKVRHSGGLSSSAGILDWGTQCVAWTPHSWGKTYAIVITLLYVVHLPWCVSWLYCIVNLSTPHLWFFLHVYSCRTFFLLIFILIDLIDSCFVNCYNTGVPSSWEEVSSVSSYSVILTTPLSYYTSSIQYLI